MSLDPLNLILKVLSLAGVINVCTFKADINIKEKTVEAQTQAQFG